MKNILIVLIVAIAAAVIIHYTGISMESVIIFGVCFYVASKSVPALG